MSALGGVGVIDKQALLDFIFQKWKPHYKKAFSDQFDNGAFWALRELWDEIAEGKFDIKEPKKETCRWRLMAEHSESKYCARRVKYYKAECNNINEYRTPKYGNFCYDCGKPIEEVKGD